jgi:hypothetical protein
MASVNSATQSHRVAVCYVDLTARPCRALEEITTNPRASTISARLPALIRRC